MRSPQAHFRSHDPRHRALAINPLTEFERCRMATVKSEFSQEYEAHIGLAKPASKAKHSVKISSSSRI